MLVLVQVQVLVLGLVMALVVLMVVKVMLMLAMVQQGAAKAAKVAVKAAVAAESQGNDAVTWIYFPLAPRMSSALCTCSVLLISCHRAAQTLESPSASWRNQWDKSSPGLPPASRARGAKASPALA